MQMNPKLLAVILVVVVIVFVVVVIIGQTGGQGNLNLDLIASLGDTLAGTLFSASAIDLREIIIAEGEDLRCLNRVTQRAQIPAGGTCRYRIEPSSAPVRTLTLEVVEGQCTQAELDNSEGDALRAGLIITADDLPGDTYDSGEPCAEPNAPELTIFEQAGDLLTLRCLDTGEADACIVALNPDTDQEG